MLNRFFLSERNMLLAIMVNALVITMLYFPSLKDVEWLMHLDLFFIVLFIFEAVIKIRKHGIAGYFKSNWNRFDFILVVLSLPAFFELFLDIPNASLLLILRLFRLVRMVRFFRFVPHLNSVISGLGRAMKASVFVIIALAFINFLFALFSCHFFQDISPRYFGDPLIASYSIFQMFTVEGWYEIPAKISESLDNPVYVGLTRLFFVFVVMIGGIFGLSLANAVFVDEMTLDNNDALEKKVDQLQTQIGELKEMLEKNMNP